MDYPNVEEAETFPTSKVPKLKKCTKGFLNCIKTMSIGQYESKLYFNGKGS